MSLEFNEFYKLHGLRQSSQLVSPTIFDLATFTMPKRSVFHFIPTDEFQTAPDPMSLPFQYNTQPIYLLTAGAPTDLFGKPRVVAFNTVDATRDVFIRNKRFRRLTEISERDKQANEIVTINYAFVLKHLIFTRSAYREYEQWRTLNLTVMNTMAKGLTASTRNHFIFLNLDKEVLPTKVQLDTAAAEKTLSIKTAAALNSSTKCWVAEFWKWLSDEPASSILGNLPKDKLSQVNFVFTCGKYFSVVNVGRLLAWKKTTKEQVAKDEKPNMSGFKPVDFQKYFYTMLLKIQSKSMGVVAEEAPAVTSLSKKPKLVSIAKAVVDAEKKQAQSQGGDNTKKSTPGGKTTSPPYAVEAVDELEVNEGQLREFDKSVDDDMDSVSSIVVDVDEETEEVQDFSGDDPETNAEALIEAIDTASPLDEKDAESSIIVKKADMSPSQANDAFCDAAAAAGTISAQEYRAYKDMGRTYEKMMAPDGSSTVSSFIVTPPEMLKVQSKKIMEDRPSVLDKSMIESTLQVFDPYYITNIHHRDLMATAVSAQYGGVMLRNYEYEVIEDVAGAYDSFSFSYLPINGVQSTVNTLFPKLNPDGTFFANGVTYRMKKQQYDQPIRKVSPTRVALTSIAFKMFVDKSERKAANYTVWLGNAVMELAEQPNAQVVKGVTNGVAFDPEVKVPPVYSALGMRFISIVYKDFIIDLSRETILKETPKDILTACELDGSVVAGHNGKDTYLVVDKNSVWYTYTSGELSPLGMIEDLLGLDAASAPVPYATMKVFGQDIPVGFCYAYYVGIDRLLKMLGVKPKRFNVGQRVTMEPTEYSLVFADETLVFDKEHLFASLLLGGFNEYKRFIREYRYHDFNKRSVYANVLEDNGLGVRYLRELVLMDDMFVDPITKKILEEMKEPTTFRGLIAKSVQYLCSDDHPNEVDTAYMRFRGYERFSGAFYSELVKSMRVMRGKATKTSRILEMNPYAVWNAIMRDATVMPVKEINPIEYLKDQAAVTFSGTGGRTGRTMVSSSRKYSNSSKGIVSEATVDSGDVGINTYLSGNPQLTNVYGMPKAYEKGKTGTSSVISTSALLAPGSDRDDPRRVGFVSIQNSHTVACKGYTQPMLRTGKEQTIAYEVGDMFSAIAEEDGKITHRDERSVTVTYKSGKTKSVEIGRRFGKSAGMVIPHTIACGFKEGQTIKKGRAIAFNSDFFEEDFINPGQLILKFNMVLNVAMYESPMTHEDSCCISYRVSKLLVTKMGIPKDITVRFDQSVRDLKQPGEKVSAGDILCVIENTDAAGKNFYSEASLDTLRMLNAFTPSIDVDGMVEKMEIFYHGDLEDMSPSLRTLVKNHDKQLAAFRKNMGKKVVTGEVDQGFRVGGKPLDLDSLLIRLHVTSDVSAGTADKIVFSNQIKSVVGKLIPDDVVTEKGVRVDALFGQLSLDARIVRSPYLIGTTNLCLQLIGKQAVLDYET